MLIPTCSFQEDTAADRLMFFSAKGAAIMRLGWEAKCTLVPWKLALPRAPSSTPVWVKLGPPRFIYTTRPAPPEVAIHLETTPLDQPKLWTQCLVCVRLFSHANFWNTSNTNLLAQGLQDSCMRMPRKVVQQAMCNRPWVDARGPNRNTH